MNSLKNISNSKKSGFTFVELLFAIVVMGTMFGLALTVFIGMLRFYVFANTVRQNQENSRNILDTISRDVKFGKLLIPYQSSPSATQLCVYSPESNKTILYSLSNGNITKYTSNSVFATFAEAVTQRGSGSCSTTNSTSATLTLTNTKVLTFNVNFTDGANNKAFTDVASATIEFVNITGKDVNGNCITSDIYCNKLTLNTAINFRGGD